MYKTQNTIINYNILTTFYEDKQNQKEITISDINLL